MQIGELSKKTGVSRDTIRYYEKLGLIPPPKRAGLFNNYKNYTAPVLKRLLAIRKIKAYGFTLKETQAMLIFFEEGVLERDRGNRYIAKKIAGIEHQINELAMVKKRLEDVLEADKKTGTCPISRILDEMVTA